MAGICASVDEQEARRQSAAIQADLVKAGFVLNTSKSRLGPHQLGEWFGFVIDLVEGVPDEKT